MVEGVDLSTHDFLTWTENIYGQQLKLYVQWNMKTGGVFSVFFLKSLLYF